MALVLTAAGRLIVGSRDVTREKADPSKYSLQFPNGGLASSPERIDTLQSDATRNKTFKQNVLLQASKAAKLASIEYDQKFDMKQESYSPMECVLEQEALCKARMEVYNCPDSDIKSCGLVGLLKRSIDGKREYLKAATAVFSVPYTLQ